MDLCVKYPDQFGKYKWVLVVDVGMIFGGLIAVFSGGYTSLSAIATELHIKHFGTEDSFDLCVYE